MSATIEGPDGKSRCRWCGAAPEFLDYHDTEWGYPVRDDHRLFEKLSLESFVREKGCLRDSAVPSPADRWS